MDSLISTFHIDWHLIVAQAINFVVVLLVLYFFALKPLKKLMEERGATIAGGLDNAKKQEELVKAQQAEYDKAIAQARVEASVIIKEAKKDVEKYRENYIAKTQEEAKSILEANIKKFSVEQAKLIEEGKKQLTELVFMATEKVIGSSITDKIEAKLVEDSIKQI